MKIALNYDPSTGYITDDVGSLVCVFQGLGRFEITDKKEVDHLVELKKAGFDVNEIIELDKKGLI